MLQLNGENYMILCDNTEFTNRQKSIFDKLDEVKVVNHAETNIVHKSQAKKFMKTDAGKICTDFNKDSGKGKQIDTKYFKGKESIFKRPEIPPPRQFRQKIPDFQKNPHKWKKYSLCDVSQDDMSEKSNTAAAMAFLKEIRSRKSLDEPVQTDDKILFKQPLRPKPRGAGSHIIQVSNEYCPGEDGTAYFRGSKLVMPEYVIGDKKKQMKAKKDCPSTDISCIKVVEIKLNHLIQYNDEEEKDEDMNDDICD